MIVADLEIHSRYARACSRTITPLTLNTWAKLKGVDLLSCGDITHPLWRREITRATVEQEPGFFVLREEEDNPTAPRFILGGEVSLIFRQGENLASGRRVHLLFFAPSLAAVEKLVALISPLGKLASDGRPTLALTCRAFARACQEADPEILVVPAHIWTPWFGLLGSKSGFESVEEAFGDQAGTIRAYETGLSADPPMCWRAQTLRSRVIISGSDLHSLSKMMREATLFNGKIGEYNYSRLKVALSQPGNPDYHGTLEFYPQEGKYHADGHAACGVVLEPEQTQKLKGRCPKCGEAVTVGVNHRVTTLATHPPGDRPLGAGTVIYAVPLQEIIAEALGKGRETRAVQQLYHQMTETIGPEFTILLETVTFPAWVPERVVEGLTKARAGEVQIDPGYDGIYGRVKLLGREEAPLTLWETLG